MKLSAFYTHLTISSSQLSCISRCIFIHNKPLKKTVDKCPEFWYHTLRYSNGGIAQLARACGSYPQCPRFKSRCRYQGAASLRLLYGPLVKWLRHRPFTAVTWVQIPYGSPKARVYSFTLVFSFYTIKLRGGSVEPPLFVVSVVYGGPSLPLHLLSFRIQS